MAYELDQFIADCRSTLKSDPGPAGREQVRAKLEQLLQNKDFVEKYCGEHVDRGLKVLYEDPELKFQVLAHINDKARVSPPHDHGESWAIYGQATLWTDMIEWKREDDGSKQIQWIAIVVSNLQVSTNLEQSQRDVAAEGAVVDPPADQQQGDRRKRQDDEPGAAGRHGFRSPRQSRIACGRPKTRSKSPNSR